MWKTIVGLTLLALAAFVVDRAVAQDDFGFKESIEDIAKGAARDAEKHYARPHPTASVVTALPRAGRYEVVQVFVVRDEELRTFRLDRVRGRIHAYGGEKHGWLEEDVPDLPTLSADLAAPRFQLVLSSDRNFGCCLIDTATGRTWQRKVGSVESEVVTKNKFGKKIREKVHVDKAEWRPLPDITLK